MNRLVHCVACGDFCCSHCNKYSTIPKLFFSSPQRVCELCFQILREENKKSFTIPFNNSNKHLKLKIVVSAYETGEEGIEPYLALCKGLQEDGNLVFLLSDECLSDFVKKEVPSLVFCGIHSELENVTKKPEYYEAVKEGSAFSLLKAIASYPQFFPSALEQHLSHCKGADIIVVGNNFDFIGITAAQYYNMFASFSLPSSLFPLLPSLFPLLPSLFFSFFSFLFSFPFSFLL